MKIQEINRENKFRSKEYIERKKKIKKRLFWIKFILIFILSVASCLILALSPIFNLKLIEVKGSFHYKQTEIINATSLVLGENGFKTIGNSISNLLTLRYGMEEKNIINKFPYVKSVSVRFVLPDKMKINIEERNPIAYISYNGTFLYMDEEAVVVDIIPAEKTKLITELKGIKFQKFKLGQELKVDDEKKIETFNKIYNAIIEADNVDNFDILKILKYVDVSDLQKVVINLDSRVSINFGDLSDLNYKINFMKKNFVAIQKNEKGFLDMTLEQPIFKPE